MKWVHRFATLYNWIGTHSYWVEDLVMSALLLATGKAESAATLPSLDHLLMADYDNVYEPSEDTYLMCDALNNDRSELQEMGCRLVLEIGSGSGCNITYLASLLQAADPPATSSDEGTFETGGDHTVTATRPACVALATDINPYAVEATKRTAAANSVVVECVCADLVAGAYGVTCVGCVVKRCPHCE